jgi:hypothetical protein
VRFRKCAEVPFRNRDARGRAELLGIGNLDFCERRKVICRYRGVASTMLRTITLEHMENMKQDRRRLAAGGLPAASMRFMRFTVA